MPFTYISYLELWQPFCSAEGNHLCNFGKWCYEEHLQNYFKFRQVVKEESRLKIFLI